MRAHVRRIFQVNRACGDQALSKYSREGSLVEIPDTVNIQKIINLMTNQRCVQKL